MPTFLLACHAHTSRCTFGLEACPDRHNVTSEHFALGDIKKVLEEMDKESKAGCQDAFTSDNTDTMDVNNMSKCKPSIVDDVFTSIPIGVYDFIIMPDCSGAWFFEQERDKDFGRPERLFQFHNTMFTNILQALKPDGYLIYSKMIHIRKPHMYIEVMNNWFAITGMPFEVKYYNTDGMSWFVMHKIPIGKCKSISKSKARTPKRRSENR